MVVDEGFAHFFPECLLTSSWGFAHLILKYLLTSSLGFYRIFLDCFLTSTWLFAHLVLKCLIISSWGLLVSSWGFDHFFLKYLLTSSWGFDHLFLKGLLTSSWVFNHLFPELFAHLILKSSETDRNLGDCVDSLDRGGLPVLHLQIFSAHSHVDFVHIRADFSAKFIVYGRIL